MLTPDAMSRLLSSLASSAPFLVLALAACGGSSAPADSPPATGPDASTGGDGSVPSVPIAQSALPRDPASAISAATLQGAVTANNAFAVDLYAQVLADREHDRTSSRRRSAPRSR